MTVECTTSWTTAIYFITFVNGIGFFIKFPALWSTSYNEKIMLNICLRIDQSVLITHSLYTTNPRHYLSPILFIFHVLRSPVSIFTCFHSGHLASLFLVQSFRTSNIWCTSRLEIKLNSICQTGSFNSCVHGA